MYVCLLRMCDYLYIGVQVCVCTYTWVWHAQGYVHMWRSEADVGTHPPLLSHLIQ